MNLAYRTTQFFRLLFDKPAPQDLSLVEETLSLSLMHLFRGMTAADQTHAIRVLHTLLEQGQRDPSLLAAALLHDVGKSHVRPRLWDRVAVVLGTAIVPNAVQRWGHGEHKGWRRPFIIAARHPTWGAEMILAAGGSQELATLVSRHQDSLKAKTDTQIDQLLHHLQEADGMN